MKFRICVIVVMLIASAALVVRAVRLAKQEPVETVKTVKTEQATIKIFNNTINNAWVNVPIEVKSLGGHDYRVTNKTKMVIRRFYIALYAPDIGKPARGEGVHRHEVPVQVTDKPIAPGKSIDINIERELGEFSTNAHNHTADTNRIEMLPYVVDFADENFGKRWFGGKYYRLTSNNEWEDDPDLNPKQSPNVIQQSPNVIGNCYAYASLPSCSACNTGDPTCDTTSCKKPVFHFVSNPGGVHRALACKYCRLLTPQGVCDLFGGTICAHGDGSPCTVLVLDLNVNDPC